MDELYTAGIGIALGLGLLYLVLRGTAWSPGRGDPVQAVRTHAMITALIALFASGTAGLNGLITADAHEVLDQGSFPVTTEDIAGGVRETISGPVPPLDTVEALLTVLGPALGLVLVYLLAQHTWPRPSGAVRTARLADRRPLELLPRALTALSAAVLLGALGLVALAWTAPGVAARRVEKYWGGTGPADAVSSSSWTVDGVRAGAEVAPWLLAALVLTALGVLVVLRVIARRPVLHGLHPTDDDLVRRIAVNRAIRTATAMMLGIGMTAHSLHTAARFAPEGVQWLGMAALVLLLVLLLWRSPHVSELGSHTAPGIEGPDAGRGARVPTAPAAPGTARAVLRLRRDGAGLALLSLVPIAVVALVLLVRAAPQTDAESWGWRVIVAVTLPVAVALAVLGLTEVGVRRGHSLPTGPATGRLGLSSASRWPRLALGLAVGLAGVWSGLSLTTPEPQTGLALALAAGTAVLAVSAVCLARMALRRPPLGRATAAQDAALRRAGADRLLAAGAAGILTVTGAALLLGVQVWNMFVTSAVLELGINGLPEGLLVLRAVVLFGVFALVVACLVAPSPEVPVGEVTPEEREAVTP